MDSPAIVWLKNGRILKQVEDTVQIVDNLPKKIYTLQINERTGELYLEEFADEFHFNFKIYGMETQLITEDDYGDKYFIKVLNLDNKPSLYRGGLVY